MHVSPISPRFLRGLHANLAYWRAETAVLSPERRRALNADFPNLRQALDMALQLPETRSAAAALLLHCFFWVEAAGHVPAWTPLVARAAALLPADAFSLRYRLLKQLGQFQRMQRQLDAALATLAQAQQLLDQVDDPNAPGELQLNLCQVYRDKRDLPRAQQHGERAVALLPEDATRLQGLTLQIMGQIAQDRGELPRAIALYRQALPLLAQPDDPTAVARTLNALAVAYQLHGRTAAALAQYQALIDLLADSPNVRARAEALLNLGSLHYGAGQLDAAEAAFRQAAALLQPQAGLLFSKALAANNLGAIARDRGDWPAAEAQLRQALRLFQHIGDELMEANTRGNLAELHIRRGQPDAATAELRAARALAARHPDHAWGRQLAAEFQEKLSRVLH